MLPRFGALFEGINNYAYEPVTTADDDECMICKEPYLKDDSSGADGYHAIRLTECGHIIGLEYRNRERWPYRHQRLLIALEALHTNRLTYTHASHIMTSYVFNALVSRPNWLILYPIFTFGALINILLISYVRHDNEGSPFYVFNILLYKIWELLTETPADPENMILSVSCMLSVAMVVVICTVNHILFFGSAAQVLVTSLRKSKRNELVPGRSNHVYVTSTSLQASTLAF
jgi:hypothetical protein